MIQSTTAIKRLQSEASEPIKGRPAFRGSDNMCVIGYGISEANLRRWFIRQGFRGDGEKCAWRRWLADWLDVGLVLPFYMGEVGHAKGYWWTEIRSEDVAGVDYYARSEGEPGAGIYELNGVIAKEKILRVQGRSK